MQHCLGTYRTAGIACWALPFAAGLQTSAALAQTAASPLNHGFLGTAAILALSSAGVMLAAFAIQRLRKRIAAQQEQIATLELALNEAESSLKVEPQIMLVWKGADSKLSRIVGSLKGFAKVPSEPAEIVMFDYWLEADSAANLTAATTELRKTGKAFGIGVRTIAGELLEADGRAAGGLATLRFRLLAGDRKAVTELAYDADKLAKQVERLSAILDAAPFPVWIKNKDGALAWANQSYIRAIEAPDLIAALKSRIQLAATDTLDPRKADIAAGLKGRAHAVQGGKRRAFNIHELDIHDGSAGFAIDVSALELAEKELERHINAHASTLDKIGTAIAIFGPDQRLRFHNRAYQQLWGLPEDWLKSQPSDGEILDRLRSLRVLPEQANFREWRAKQLSSYTTLEMRESYWYLPDGRSLHVVCEQHPFGGVTYLYENLTKEYQLESRYNELADVQKETLDNLAEAVALFGSDGRLRLCNLAFQRFWALDFSAGSDGPHVDALMKAHAASGEARAAWSEIKYGITGLDGTRKVVAGRFSHNDLILRYRAIPLPDGNALLTFSDVSDAVRAEQALRDRTEALEAADRLKTNFLANISYQVRTPLTSISGFAEALAAGLMGQLAPKQRDYVLGIHHASGELTTIIDAIIDLSAIDAGAMELKLGRVDVTDLLERATARVMSALERRNQSVDIEVADNVPEIMGDETRLEQVLGHLLANASGFSPEGGRISMGARRAGDFVQIWVADKGRGMDSEFQAKAFERFQSKPSAGSHRGPGLGLALVKSFTELHGGRVSLVSKLDQGTTVVCSLPIAGPSRQTGRGGKSREAA